MIMPLYFIFQPWVSICIYDIYTFLYISYIQKSVYIFCYIYSYIYSIYTLYMKFENSLYICIYTVHRFFFFIRLFSVKKSQSYSAARKVLSCKLFGYFFPRNLTRLYSASLKMYSAVLVFPVLKLKSIRLLSYSAEKQPNKKTSKKGQPNKKKTYVSENSTEHLGPVTLVVEFGQWSSRQRNFEIFWNKHIWQYTVFFLLLLRSDNFRVKMCSDRNSTLEKCSDLSAQMR